MTDPSAIPSPCRRQCQLHPIERVCLGCFRSIDEVAKWARLSAKTRARVMDELPTRRAAWEAKEERLRQRVVR